VAASGETQRRTASNKRQTKEVPGGNGHKVMFSPPLWTDHVDRYLDSIGAVAKQ
jgi:hypothetical protein